MRFKKGYNSLIIAILALVSIAFLLSGLHCPALASEGLRVPLSLTEPCLRPGHGFSEDKKNEAAQKFLEITGIINPSILAIKELRSKTEIDEAKVIEKAIFALEVQLAKGVKIPWLHYDIIGGKSNIVRVDNPEQTIKILTPGLLRRIKEAAEKKNIFFVADVHIMVEEVEEDFIRRYINAGADYITLHWEGYADENALLERIKFIKAKGRKAGMAFNPDIDIEKIAAFVSKNSLQNEIDLFLQMSVYPGKGGQELIKEVLENIPKLKTKVSSSALIEIDGGIDPSTVIQTVEAGVDVFVTGSAFFGKKEQAKLELEKNFDAFTASMRRGL